MKRLILNLLCALLTSGLCAQDIQLSAPFLIGKEIKLHYYAGTNKKTLITKIDDSGKAFFTISQGDYQGIATLEVTDAGSIELVVAEPSVVIQCLTDVLSEESISFPDSKENHFFKQISASRNHYTQQQSWLKTANELFDKDTPFLSLLPSEFERINTNMEMLNKEVQASPLYVANYFCWVDFIMHLYEIPQLNKEQTMQLRKEMETELDVVALYHSGSLWNTIRHTYLNLFYHTEEENKQIEFAEFVKQITQKLSGICFEDFLAIVILDTERFDWREAQDAILSALPVDFAPKHEGLKRALNAYHVRSGKLALPELVGLSEDNHSYNQTLLAFYDSDCGNCIEEMNALIDAYPQLKEQNTRVVSIAADMDRAQYEEKSRHFPWSDVLCDFEGFAGINFSNYNVMKTPSFYLLDKNHKLQGQYNKVNAIIESL